MCKLAKQFKQELNRNKDMISPNFFNKLSKNQQEHLTVVLRGRSL